MDLYWSLDEVGVGRIEYRLICSSIRIILWPVSVIRSNFVFESSPLEHVIVTFECVFRLHSGP